MDGKRSSRLRAWEGIDPEGCHGRRDGRHGLFGTVAALAVAIGCACGLAMAAPTIIDDRTLADDGDGRNWAAYGRTFGETHFSPLTEINASTVGRLGLAWSLDLEPQNVLSTPFAVDGVIYLAVGYSIVHAVDARTGRLLWRYDPGVTERAGVKLRTGWGIRGLAYWKGRFSSERTTGDCSRSTLAMARPWSVQTIDAADGSFVSGPPRVFDDKVVIGFGGGDFGPVRGYITAYDTATGKQLWRFWTVPGDPARGFENPAMEMAARTWVGALVGAGRRWNGLERHDLRSGIQSALPGHRQWWPLESTTAQPRWW